MPAPLLGALARSVAQAGSSAFASQAARAAATGAAKGAAAGAAQGAAATSGGGGATMWTHAGGWQPAAPAAAAPAVAAPVPKAMPAPPTPKASGSGGGAMQWTAQGGWQPAGSSASGAKTAAAAPKTAPVPAGAGAPPPPTTPTATAATSPGASQPKAGKPSFWEQAKTMAKDMGREMFSKKEPKTVDDDTKGMSLEDRYKRLEDSGQLLNPTDVGKASGVPYPSQQDVVTASEQAEQRNRERAAEEQEKGRGALGKMAGEAKVGVIAALPAAITAMAVGLPRIAGYLENWGTGVLESSRHLRRFDAAIAKGFAELDHQALVMQMRTARATGGSTAALADSLKSLRNELQPFREQMTSAVNLIAIKVVQAAGLLVEISKWSPILVALGRVINYYEAEERKKHPAHPGAFEGFYRDVLQGNFARPNNKRPGE